jgi:hypothetical protein
MYGGKPPRAARLAAGMAADLVQRGFVPVTVETFDGWWLVTCQVDWLNVSGAYHANYWRRIVPAPEIGDNAMRMEVLLTAFSAVLFTVTAGSVEFIAGANEINNDTLRDKATSLSRSDFRGRAVGFIAD